MTKITVIFAHPALEKSRAHKRLVHAINNIEDVEIRDIYELYPDFQIDIQEEQRVLNETDILVVQFPMYWYSVPAAMKEWFDLVLEMGYAYGDRHELAGKKWISVLTTGGSEEAYSSQGLNSEPVTTYLKPQHQTAKFCKMVWLEPLIFHATHAMSDKELDLAAEDYRRRLIELIDAPAEIKEDA